MTLFYGAGMRQVLNSYGLCVTYPQLQIYVEASGDLYLDSTVEVEGSTQGMYVMPHMCTGSRRA